MVVIVRLELDRYTLQQLTDLVLDGVVTINECIEGAVSIKALSEYDQLMWVRAIQAKRKAG